MKSAAKRVLVLDTCKRYKVSTRRACGLFGLQESTWYYRPKERNDQALRKALNRHATEHPWGYRGLMDWLMRDGFNDNHKRVYRVYAEEGLQLGQRKRRQKLRYRGSKLDEPSRLNEL